MLIAEQRSHLLDSEYQRTHGDQELSVIHGPLEYKSRISVQVSKAITIISASDKPLCYSEVMMEHQIC